MDPSVLAAPLNAQGARPLEVVFIAFVLAAIGAAFLISWLRDRRQDPSLTSAEIDSGEWLLRALAVLAIAVVAAFVWLTLHGHS
jgi:chromate transport protein ChrA